MRGIRKLLTQIAILIVVCCALIFGVHIVRPAPANTACIQLLSLFPSSVLIVDSTFGLALPDARPNFLPPETTNVQNTAPQPASLRNLFANDADSFIAWRDAAYAAISTRTHLTLYRLSDGTPLFSDMAPSTAEITFFVAPDEHAALLFRERDSGFGRQNLSLITARLRKLMPNADSFAQPTWSVDSAIFTFAYNDNPNIGWTLNVMSRDGELLRHFILPANTRRTPYQQTRWTNCQ